MLVIALAQPFIDTIKGGVEPGIILIDNTYSTQQDPDYYRVVSTLKEGYSQWTIIEYDEKSSNDSLRKLIHEKKTIKKSPNPNIILLTDLQDNQQNGDIIQLVDSLSEKVFIIPKIKNGINHAISDFRVINTNDNDMTGVEVRVSGDHLFGVGNALINVNGKYIGQSRINDLGYAEFYFSGPSEEQLSCIAEIDDDDYPEDNKRYLVVNKYNKINILCVRNEGEPQYHLNALRAMERIDLSELSSGELPKINIYDYDLLWFSGLYPINANRIRSLKKYAETHPILITVGNDLSQKESWREICGNVEIENNQTGYLTVKEPRAKIDKQEFRIKKYYTTDKTAGRILLEASNGAPLLFEGDENIYLLMSPFNFEWNEMGLSPYFTRAIGEMLNMMLEREITSIDINEPIELNGSYAHITTPGGEKYQAQDVFTKTNLPGFYSIEDEDGKRITAANAPSDECLQTRLSPENIHVIKWDGRDISAINDQIRGRNAQTLFYILAAILIILEMILLGKGERTK